MIAAIIGRIVPICVSQRVRLPADHVPRDKDRHPEALREPLRGGALLAGTALLVLAGLTFGLRPYPPERDERVRREAMVELRLSYFCDQHDIRKRGARLTKKDIIKGIVWNYEYAFDSNPDYRIDIT